MNQKPPFSQPDHPSPPRWADRLLAWFVAPHLLEYVQGDLYETFQKRVHQVGLFQARREYVWAVLHCLTPFFAKRNVVGPRQAGPRKTQSFFPANNPYPNPAITDMFRNYLKIAWRNLAKNKVYSAINIGGLAAGMAVAMLIGLWVYDELSFNRYHKNYDRIAQVMQNQTENGEIKSWDHLPFPFIHELKTNYAGSFKRIVASTDLGNSVLTAGEEKVSKKGLYIEAEAPDMFTLHMLKGSRMGLQNPQSILLSESTAKALFGDTDPMGKTVQIGTDQHVAVTGVYEDLPHNSQFHDTQFLASWDYYVATNRWMRAKKWDNHALWLFVELQPNTTFANATARIKDSEVKVIRRLEGMKAEAATNPQIWLNPMRDWHLYSDFKNGVASDGPVQYVWLVGCIGFFVLLLACINFMNLSTARSEKRAKEVGIRKAVGSLRGQLIVQFFGESFLVVFLSFTLTLLLVVVSLPWFNDLAAKQITIPWTNPYFWVGTVGFIVLTGLLAGSYPALYLTSFQPVKVLKGTGLSRSQTGRFASVPRQVLVITQFTISITLIIGTVAVLRQIQFAKNRPVGYSRDGLLLVPMQSGDFYGKATLLRSELENTGVVTEVSESQSPVTGVWSTNDGFRWKGMSTPSIEQFATLTVTPEYAKTVGWHFLAGRNFSPELASDSSGFIINERAAKLMGLKQPIGEVISWKSQWMTNNVEKPFRILGVVKDMVMESPFEPVKPTVFFLFGQPNWINIRLNPAVSTADALPKIEAVFKKLIPSAPFDYKFADQEYALKFAAEERISKLASFFAILAIIISCLGLFGLASYVAEQRTREISIRKVMGASVTNLWGLLSKDFIVLVGIAFGISTLVSWYFLTGWLQRYNYRTDLSWWIFVASGIGALLVTLLTISFQSVKVALVNPIKSLRNE